MGQDAVKRSYSPGQFEFQLDGSEAFYVKSFEGGLAKGNVVEETIGPSQFQVKHLATFEVEPVTVEMGMQDGLPMLQWIRSSWHRQSQRKNGTIRQADFDMTTKYEYQFLNGLITETTFPTLDGAGKDGATLKVKIQPEQSSLGPGDGQVVKAQGSGYPKQKMWNVSCFAFELNGHDTRHVGKIEGFTVKQGVKAYNTGRERFASWEPTKLTFPDISIHISMAFADDMINWYNKTVYKGGKDPSLETSGSIRFLTPDKAKTLFEIDLKQVGVKGMSIDKGERGESARRVKFDLYVGEMDIGQPEFSLFKLLFP